MKKSRFTLALVFVLALTVFAGALAGCGQQQSASSQSKEDFSISAEPVEEEPPIVLKDKPFYVLVFGNDSREGTVEINQSAYADGKGRSDTMMMVRVDPKNYQLTFVTIPRDTAVYYDDEQHKLNETFTDKGVEGLEEQIELLTGVTFDYYLECTFPSFEQLIDDKGGLAADVRYDMSMQDIVSGDYIEYPAGWYDSLNGAETLVYARERHAYGENGEALRQSNDRYILQCIIEQITEDPKNAIELATKMAGNIKTDWDTRELLAYVEDFVAHADEITFKNGTGPYYGDTDPDTGKWVAVRDEETWAEVVRVVDEGGDPNDVVSAPTLYPDLAAPAESEETAEE